MRTDPVRDDVPPIEFESLVRPCLLAVSVPIPSSPELLSLSLLPPEFCSGKKFLVNCPKPGQKIEKQSPNHNLTLLCILKWAEWPIRSGAGMRFTTDPEH